MDISSFPILSLIIFLPLVGALVIALIPRRNLGAIRGTALLFALATWVASLWLVLGFLPGRNVVASAAGSFQFVQAIDWIPLFGIQYKVGADERQEDDQAQDREGGDVHGRSSYRAAMTR